MFLYVVCFSLYYQLTVFATVFANTLLQCVRLTYRWWRFGAVGSDVGRINEVTLRRARLVLGWVTVSGFNSRCGKIYLSLTNHPGQLSLAIPSWVGTMSTGQRAVMLCDWGVKADIVLFAGNTVWSISERVRGVCVDALYKSTFTLL